MFEVAIIFLTEMIKIIPLFVCIVLLFNIISDLLWGGK